MGARPPPPGLSSCSVYCSDETWQIEQEGLFGPILWPARSAPLKRFRKDGKGLSAGTPLPHQTAAISTKSVLTAAYFRCARRMEQQTPTMGGSLLGDPSDRREYLLEYRQVDLLDHRAFAPLPISKPWKSSMITNLNGLPAPINLPQLCNSTSARTKCRQPALLRLNRSPL